MKFDNVLVILLFSRLLKTLYSVRQSRLLLAAKRPEASAKATLLPFVSGPPRPFQLRYFPPTHLVRMDILPIRQARNQTVGNLRHTRPVSFL
jgi:hypothetical protein